VAEVSLAYGIPRFTSAAFATSQGVVNFDVPTGLNCTRHCAGSATTVTGAVAAARSRAGFAKWVSARKSGKYVSAASARPVMMIGLRPTRSDRLPKMRKKGVARSSEPAMSRFAVWASTLSVCVRKNRV
jgi:hypothetical protein